MNYKAKLEINVLDLCHYVFRKWRSIVICALIIAIIACGYGYYMPRKTSYDDGVKEIDSNADYSNVAVDKLAAQLSETEQNEVYVALQTYYDYKKTYTTNQDYINNSVFINLDPLTYPTYVISYSISDYYGYGEVAQTGLSVIDNIITVYRDGLLSQDVLDAIRTETGKSLEDGYITELYSVTKAGLSVMQVIVHAPTHEECEIITHILEKKINASIESTKNAYPHTILKTAEYYYEANSTYLSDMQKSKADSIAAIEKSMLTLKSSMNKIQQAFYTDLLNVAENYMDESGIIDTNAMLEGEGIGHVSADIPKDNDNKSQKRRLEISYVLFGLLLGALLAIMWHVLTYVFSSRLRTKEDIANAFGLSVLAELKSGDRYNKAFGFIDRAIDGMFTKKKANVSAEEQLRMITSGIAFGARKIGLSNVFVTSVNCDEEVAGWRSRITDNVNSSSLDIEGFSIDNGASPFDDYSTLDKMSVADSIVLVEKFGVTRYEDIAKIIELCRMMGIKVLGSVVIE